MLHLFITKINESLLCFFIELKLVESVPVIEEKWPIWDKRFDDINKLIEHSETHYEPPKTTITETAQCPICQKYFGIPELIKHWNQDHIL